MLGLFERIALERIGDFGIAFTLGLAAHREIHADFAALAVEMIPKTLHNLGVFDLAVSDDVLARPGLLAFLGDLHLELGAGNAAKRTLLGSIFAVVNIPANGANPSLHSFLLSTDSQMNPV